MTAAGTGGGSDPWEMALVHRLIRRGFEQARTFVAAPGADRRTAAIADYVSFHLDGLHAHHSTEDELIWPALRERAELSGELVDRMEAQHEGIHQAVDASRRDLAAWVVAPSSGTAASLSDSLALVLERLTEHLADEEREIVPLIATHVTQAEWEHLGQTAFAKFTPRQRFTAMGEMIRTASPEEAARMNADLPWPIHAVWTLVGRRRYERAIAAAGGE